VALAAGHGQGWRQIGELLIAFGLSSVIGLERQIRRKSAGLRTQAIVGTASALILLVSKYGFADVLAPGRVVLDPSRVAAQIVSGVGFLGAGLIITRQGSIRGLTTAASVWETAAIGMAAGAGLPLLAGLVTALHFVIVLGYTPLIRRLPGADGDTSQLRITYQDGQGVLRQLLVACTTHGWTITAMSTEARRSGALGDLVDDQSDAPREVTVTVSLSGSGVHNAANALGAVAGVSGIERLDDEGD